MPKFLQDLSLDMLTRVMFIKKTCICFNEWIPSSSTGQFIRCCGSRQSIESWHEDIRGTLWTHFFTDWMAATFLFSSRMFYEIVKKKIGKFEASSLSKLVAYKKKMCTPLVYKLFNSSPPGPYSYTWLASYFDWFPWRYSVVIAWNVEKQTWEYILTFPLFGLLVKPRSPVFIIFCSPREGCISCVWYEKAEVSLSNISYFLYILLVGQQYFSTRSHSRRCCARVTYGGR